MPAKTFTGGPGDYSACARCLASVPADAEVCHRCVGEKQPRVLVAEWPKENAHLYGDRELPPSIGGTHAELDALATGNITVHGDDD